MKVSTSNKNYALPKAVVTHKRHDKVNKLLTCQILAKNGPFVMLQKFHAVVYGSRGGWL